MEKKTAEAKNYKFNQPHYSTFHTFNIRYSTGYCCTMYVGMLLKNSVTKMEKIETQEWQVSVG